MTALALALALAAAPPMPLGGDYWKDVSPAAGQLFGLADLHAHFFTDLAYGGRILHGQASAPGGPEQALRSCKKNHGGITVEGPHDHRGWPTFEGWPKWNSLVHQQAYVDWIRRAWQGGLRIVQMDVQNTPFLGEVSATANRLLLHGDLQPLPNTDTSALWIQTAAARALIERGPASDFAEIAYSAADARRIVNAGKLAVVLGIEVEALGGYLRPELLAGDPARAVRDLVETLYAAGVRHVIPIHLMENAFGHPAVFQRTLGAMNYAVRGEYYAMEDGFDRGIRFDLRKQNANPIASIFESQAHASGKFAMPAYRAHASAEGLTPEGELLIRALLEKGMLVDIDHMSEQAADGTLTIAESVNLPVMASHTSFRDLTFGTTLQYGAGAADYTAQLVATPYGEKPELYGTSEPAKTRTDRSRTRRQLERIRALGGLIGLQIHTEATAVSWRDRVANDCDGTTKSFAQLLGYALDVFGPDSVTMGTDVGGFSELTGPRFGPSACPSGQKDHLRASNGRIRAQALAQKDGVRYSTDLLAVESFRLKAPHTAQWTWGEDNDWLAGPANACTDVVKGRWAAMKGNNAPLIRGRTGQRDWDVNLDGMAHYGMLPDFLQDIANVLRASGPGGDALAKTAMDSMLGSAERYVQMWERLESAAATP
jgi:microsomal dipeptidase-like Zn-dependent dipeptidase